MNRPLVEYYFRERLMITLTLLLTTILVTGGCSDDEEPVSGKDLNGESTVSEDGGARAETGGGTAVEVIFQTKSTRVELSQVDPVSLDGTSYARLSEVVSFALDGQALDTMVIDFEAADGFKPAKSSNCQTLIPLPGATLAQGYIQLQSRLLRWEDALGFPGCMSLRDTAIIYLTLK